MMPSHSKIVSYRGGGFPAETAGIPSGSERSSTRSGRLAKMYRSNKSGL